MKKDVYGVPLEEFDVFTENENDPCFDISFVPSEYYDSLKKGSLIKDSDNE